MCGAAAMSAEDDFRIRPGRIRSTRAQRARPFIVTPDHRPVQDQDSTVVRARLAPPPKQLSLFG